MIQAINSTINNKQVTFGQNSNRRRQPSLLKEICVDTTAGAIIGASWHTITSVATKNYENFLPRMARESVSWAGCMLLINLVWGLTKKLFKD